MESNKGKVFIASGSRHHMDLLGVQRYLSNISWVPRTCWRSVTTPLMGHWVSGPRVHTQPQSIGGIFKQTLLKQQPLSTN